MGKKVLIVDDSLTARKMIRRSLPPDWDAEILDAPGGEEAILKLTEDKIDVVFLDLTMPGVDGYQVLKWMKEAKCPAVVIVVTGDVQPKAKLRVLLLGAFEFVEKPPAKERVREVLMLAGVL